MARLRSLEERAFLGGGPQAIARLRKRNKLTARERIAALLDADSFIELYMLAECQSQDFGLRERKVPGDAVAVGHGTIGGRLVFVYAQDVTVLGGSVGWTHGEKICRLMDEALKVKAPIIGLFDSGGARINEGSAGSVAVAEIFFRNTFASGVVPQISAMLGTCAGVAVYSPAISDFVFMTEEGSEMMITGPGVIRQVTGEDITPQELGGARVHSQITGTAHFIASDDLECMRQIRRLMSFLPSNNMEQPPIVDTGDDPRRLNEDITDVVPSNLKRVFDMHEIIDRLVDKGDFMEVLPKYARNIIVGFGRLGGQTVGIVANQPLVMAGVLDVNSADKAARFIRFCDAFNIPLLSLVDVPGFLPGARQEHLGIIRHGAKMLYAFAEATVPKVTLVLRKMYGGAFMAMCSMGMGVDQVLAWPIAQLVVMNTESAVHIIYRRQIKEADDPERFLAEKIAEYDYKYSNPFDPAAKMAVHAVIDPKETRLRLIAALRTLRNKKVPRPERKHGNIPL
ncbi:MAG: acyl-CoA carboxylase subunit beta [Chloroflexi bacterium]|nr:acyl-CoA carboxylase subunit beta [Chloroflexota bacterium]